MVHGVLPELPNIRILGPKIGAWIPLEEYKSKLSNKSWTGRYVGHADNDSLCSILDESTNHVFHRRRTDERHEEDHETVSIVVVRTKVFPLDVRMCTQVCLMESACGVTGWDILARFVMYGGGGCTVNLYHPLMSNASSRTGIDGDLEDCLAVIVDTSKRDHECFVHGLIYKLNHTSDRYRDALHELTCFGDLRNPSVQMTAVLNVSGDHVIPQNARQPQLTKVGQLTSCRRGQNGIHSQQYGDFPHAFSYIQGCAFHYLYVRICSEIHPPEHH